MRCEWDEQKNLWNQEKHGVSFGEAQELFLSGSDYLERFDELHSDLEDRFQAIGPVTRGVLFVVFTERDDDIIRIISAREATSRERELYQRHKEQWHD